MRGLLTTAKITVSLKGFETFENYKQICIILEDQLMQCDKHIPKLNQSKQSKRYFTTLFHIKDYFADYFNCFCLKGRNHSYSAEKHS